MLKRYCGIEEAAEFLTSDTGGKINAKDVLDFAARGFIGFCIRFDGRIELSSYYPDSMPELEPIMANKWFKGYLKIPKESIWLNKKEFCVSFAEIIEALDSGSKEDNWLAHGKTRVAARPIKSVDVKTSIVEYGVFIVDTEEALIPTQDLLKFRSKNKETEKLGEDSEKPLATTERNSLLTIIGLMANDGYGNDLSKPYPLAKEIQEAAELLGIKISDDTIAGKFKEAKKILVEKSE